ncbi:electron transport complex subunit RsxG [Endozoicomonas montiporae]|uniref:Ion-translocating oxidoreductase complex subunit G n=1 Tax=Endozoicomonas montiporae CL-33 TaxID=570277 RepID=A0A142B9E5_9GAMM|nr:electron transport complex subunit RsxG [Endozoicomonas montiporae]AMO55371.1 RnfABCDGE type electron transport complex subunit G1 [Endozoicomonas montiporae CL-33]
MSKTEPVKNTLVNSIARNSLGLGLFAILTVGLIATTYVFTEDRIASQIRAFEARALEEILPLDTHDNSLLDTQVSIQPEGLLANATEKHAYVAFRGNQPVAVILPATAPDGYSGRIELLVGIYADGTLAGVRAVNHKETPGLGDKINTYVTDWILSFTGKSLNNPKPRHWAVRKDGGDFDQFAGATVTPRAVVASVYRTLNYFAGHKEALFKQGAEAMKNHPNARELQKDVEQELQGVRELKEQHNGK